MEITLVQTIAVIIAAYLLIYAGCRASLDRKFLDDD
jgi:hypothetical protein